MKTICLNMIVKNESKIIIRCLESLYNIIDYWIICDTGSNDNTCELIQNFFNNKKIKGKLIYHDWKNFGYNRNYVIEQSKNICDYLLFIDADMILINNNFNKNLTNDQYYILQINSNLKYYNTRLIKNNNSWKCIGVTHEYYSSTITNNYTKLNTLFIKDLNDGGSKSDKYERDILLLKQGIIEEPNNSRYYFYLAQSYYCIQNYKLAINFYKKRLTFNNFKEEKWYSQYKIGLCYYKLNNNIFINELLKAYNMRKTRIEPLYFIIKYFRINKQYNKCLQLINICLQVKYPVDILFIESDKYHNAINYEKCLILFYLNKIEEGYQLSNKLLLLSNYKNNIIKYNYLNYIKNIESTFNINVEYIENNYNIPDKFILNNKTKINLLNIKGGTKQIKINNNYYCCVYETCFYIKKYYFHRFIKLDLQLNIISVSSLFYFRNIETEYVTNIVNDNNIYLIINDNGKLYKCIINNFVNII